MSSTLAARIVGSRVGGAVLNRLPVPLAVARPWLLRDNRAENARDSWGRLWSAVEAPRYAAVREAVARWTDDGFIVDVGCAQGILAAGLVCRRYLGLDRHAESLQLARSWAGPHSEFVCADADSYQPDEPPDVVVLNEVLYYLPDPVATARRYADLLAPDGVLVVSLFAHAWASRRLLRTLDRVLIRVDTELVRSAQLAWTVAVYRPTAEPVARC